MLEIRINNECLDLNTGFSVSLEDTNPIFNERGSQSVPFTVPASRRNERLLNFPSRIDTDVAPNLPERTAILSDGIYRRPGIVNVTSAGRKDGITFNLGFDNSTAYNRWSEKRLSELTNLPTVNGSDVGRDDGVDGIISYLNYIYSNPSPGTDPLAIFPIAVDNQSIQKDNNTVIYWEMLNAPSHGGSMQQLTSVKRLIDGVVTEMTVPKGYGLSPFLRVWRVVELIFADLGVTIDDNIFQSDNELNRLVILNNTADTVCKGFIRYSDLMPDCTVGEFMNALWVRFGAIYNINFDTRRATLRLIRDIIKTPGGTEILDITSGPELINYSSQQYITLSAKTSLEGASPSVERFEDFIKGLDVRNVHLGVDVRNWTQSTDGLWDGDIRDEYWEFYDDDPRDEPDDYSRASAVEARSSESATFLAREFVTGMWYKLDRTNNTVKESSSSFFNWDPATPDMEPLDLSSDDECVPVIDVNNVGLGTGNYFNDRCPAFLVGVRHYHSYIKNSDSEQENGVTTPLSFVLAYTVGGRTIGRINAEGGNGLPLTLDDGTHPTLSLLFQFKDGLFAKFWADYDEILRHGNRSVEVPAVIRKHDISRIDMLSPVLFRGVRCLFDTISYSLPAGKHIPADLKLRTISTHGDYDIVKEQNIPDFVAASRVLIWSLKSEVFGEELLNKLENRQKAAQKYIDTTGYSEHGSLNDYFEVAADGAVGVSAVRKLLTWENDRSLIIPNAPGLTLHRFYQADLTYNIFEVHVLTTSNGDVMRQRADEPIGVVTVTVDYSVTLLSRWG